MYTLKQAALAWLAVALIVVVSLTGCSKKLTVRPKVTPAKIVTPVPVSAPTPIVLVTPVIVAKDGFHRIEKGECLWTITEDWFYDPFLWPVIYRANRHDLRSADLIEEGASLVIPLDASWVEKTKAREKARAYGE